MSEQTVDEIVQAKVDKPTVVNFVRSDSGAPKDDGEANSVQVKLKASGIAFEVNTQVAHSNLITDLSARLDLVLSQLSESQRTLQSAFERIGFLEAQVLQRDQIIDQLSQLTKD